MENLNAFQIIVIILLALCEAATVYIGTQWILSRYEPFTELRRKFHNLPIYWKLFVAICMMGFWAFTFWITGKSTGNPFLDIGIFLSVSAVLNLMLDKPEARLQTKLIYDPDRKLFYVERYLNGEFMYATAYKTFQEASAEMEVLIEAKGYSVRILH